MTSRFKISSKHDISTLTIHVLICWNKVTLFGQVVPMCERLIDALLTVTVLGLDLSPSPHPEVPRPAVGATKCFLQDGALGLYLHLPVLTLLSLNIAFFLATTATLYRHNLHTRFARAGQVSTISRSPVLSQEIREQFVRQLLTH